MNIWEIEGLDPDPAPVLVTEELVAVLEDSTEPTAILLSDEVLEAES